MIRLSEVCRSGRPSLVGSFTMPQALSDPHAARGGTAGDVQPPGTDLTVVNGDTVLD
jgi:hypothetical protein